MDEPRHRKEYEMSSVTKAAHTPGPWPEPIRYEDGGEGGPGWLIEDVCYVPYVGPGAERIARLIAVAPEMLEALQLALDHLNTTDATHDPTGRKVDSSMLRERLRAAIQKARGGNG